MKDKRLQTRCGLIACFAGMHRLKTGATVLRGIKASAPALLCLALFWTIQPTALFAAPASDPAFIQYFETSWDTMRTRMPDVFMAGYEGVWVPPPQRAAAGVNGIGYDLFDRFDLGSNADPTRYGSESDFRLVISEYHKASCRVFVDWLMNHNAAWDNTSVGDPFFFTGNFRDNGGYPGFALDLPADVWGDFHQPGTQSENPGGPNFNLFDGRLLGLIDIDQAQSGPNYEFIRHPVAPDADNLPMPAGALRNQPDPDNARLYPDTGLSALMPSNPGTNRNPSPPALTFFPYNTADPMAGDAVTENATALLLRSTQYYLEVLKVDGFRLDAAKHIPTWFWDNFWDAAVFNRYVGFDGTAQIPFSFIETVDSNANIVNGVRKPGEDGGPGWPSLGWDFGNRDALDLNEAGQLRDLISAAGGNSWDSVLGASVDGQDDGFNNGTIGVHHVTSHDNSFGLDDTVAQAYVLMRPGPAIVYHNALEFGPVGFPAPDSRTDALGLGDDRITTLVKIRNEYARGFFFPLNPNHADVLVFTRRTPNSEDNVLVAVNDLTANGTDTLSVTTTFPVGTRLHELTGNAADPIVDPTGTIPELLVVGGGGVVSNLVVPRNSNSASGFHGRGYVIYGPAVPTGTLSISNATTSVVPPDSGGTPDPEQRINEVTIVTSPTFDILLQTQQTDPLDPATDDAAVFRIDQGFQDLNANALVDHGPGSTSRFDPVYGFENFLTENSPLFGGGTGTYRQTIDAAALGEGFHYITVRAFRNRSAGLDPLFGEFRMVIYVDLLAPDFSLAAPTTLCSNDLTSLPADFVIKTTDTTVDRVHIFIDQPDGTDFVALASGGAGLADRFVDTFTVSRAALLSGNHRVDVVAFEELPGGGTRVTQKSFSGIQSTTGAGAGSGDVNHNGVVDSIDVFALVFFLLNPNFDPAADTNCDGRIDGLDIQGFVDAALAGP